MKVVNLFIQPMKAVSLYIISGIAAVVFILFLTDQFGGGDKK